MLSEAEERWLETLKSAMVSEQESIEELRGRLRASRVLIRAQKYVIAALEAKAKEKQ